MAEKMDRRSFVKGSLAMGLALAAGGCTGSPQGAESTPTPTPTTPSVAAGTPTPPRIPDAPVLSAEPNQKLPQGQIGKVRLSRMLLGGNLLTYATHSRELQYVSNLAAHYNTEEKILETLRIAEEHGVNTLTVHTVPRVMEILRKHRRQGGKMQWNICPWADLKPGLSEYMQVVHELLDDGCELIYLSGFHCDPTVRAGNGYLIEEAVDKIKSLGVPVGIGAHDLAVVEYCEDHDIPNDYYVKTFHHLNYQTAPKPNDGVLTYATAEIPGFWCNNPDVTRNLMKQVKKPWIAFKVMAAGAIPPEEAFRYAFNNGADFCLAGMFDFEIAHNAEIISKIFTPERPERERPWMA